ncbi:MAG: tripartite tricarboxylate transporter TctB family protein [Syntrophaceae bacterium]|jgi:hypothetical protein|nr:tripartite tricarboxylate transporter TctB family protein [Syntrophaceae bacterium]
MTGEQKRIQSHFPQVLTGLLIWGVVAGLVGFTRGLPYMDEGAPGPRFMPILLAILLSILNVLYWMETFFFKPGERLSLPLPAELVRPAGFVLVGILMIFFWERLGVVATVLIASFLELKAIQGYSWGRSVWVGVVFSLTTWVLFQFILKVPLPAGPFEFLLFL